MAQLRRLRSFRRPRASPHCPLIFPCRPMLNRAGLKRRLQFLGGRCTHIGDLAEGDFSLTIEISLEPVFTMTTQTSPERAAA